MEAIRLLLELRWLIASAALAVYVTAKLRAYYRLRAFKGPFGVGFTNFWHTRAYLRLDSHLWYRDVCEKYGESNHPSADVRERGTRKIAS